MFRLRNIIVIILIAGALWFVYGNTYREAGFQGVFQKIQTDLHEIKENPTLNSIANSIKQEVLILVDRIPGYEETNDPSTETKIERPDLNTPSEQTFSIHNIEIGDNRDKVESILGSPKRTSLNEYGIEWNAYHENYQNFMMVAYDENNKVVGLYTNHELLTSTNGITFDSSREIVLNILENPLTDIQKGLVRYQIQDNGEYNIFLIDNNYVTIFYDIHENNTVTAIQIISKDLEQQKEAYFADPSNTLKEGLEFQLFDLTNATRANHGLSILSWEENLKLTARDHSTDMAVNNYFSHTSLDGQSPFDRMEEDNISFRIAGENLATGQPSSIFAHEGLMNSQGHRENILNKDFRFLAVGVAFNENAQPFYTEKFITK